MLQLTEYDALYLVNFLLEIAIETDVEGTNISYTAKIFE